MPQSVREFFEGLESRVDASRTAGMTNTYVFDIDGAGRWTVAVDDGKVGVTEGAAPDADCTITSSEGNFERIVAGDLKPTRAHLTRKVEGKGESGAGVE